jgi:intraflagellar transport protein 52
MVVLGSVHIFDDNWLDEQENSKLQEIIFRWLLNDFQLDKIDAENPELADYHYIPDTANLADRLRVCLEETEEIPKDHNLLFDDTLFSFDTVLVPEVISLYQVP